MMKINALLWAELRIWRVQFASSVGLTLASGLIIVGQAYVLSIVINGVFLEDQSLEGVKGWMLGFIGLALMRFITGSSAELLSRRVAAEIKRSLRERVFNHLMNLGPVQVGSERSGELINTMMEGVDLIELYVREFLPRLFTSMLVPLLVLIIVLPLDLMSGLVLLLTAPLLPLFMFLIGVWANSVSQRQWASLSLMSAHFLDVLQGLTTLKLFNRSAAQVKTIARISDDFREKTMQVLRIAFLSSFVLELLTTLSIAIIAVEIGLRLLYGNMDFLTAFFVLVIAPEFYQPFRNMAASFHNARSGADALARIDALLKVPVNISHNRHATPPDMPFDIHLEGVHFSYPDRAVAALDDINLRIESGQKLALVGQSGSGKSTLAALLLQFIEPTAGNITINGIPLRSIELVGWRKRVIWISQRPYLFNDTLRANLLIARPDATLDELIWAAKSAHLLPEIDSFVHGWDTVLGEAGTRLSGGQAQRVAIARAFLKDAPLIIWDEATANLDLITEKAIQESMAHLMQGRTAIVIGHRLHTLQQMDRIAVLQAGKLVQVGSHAELVAEAGPYRDLAGAYAG